MFFLLFVIATASATPTIVSRSDWDASAPQFTKNLSKNPPPFVVIHHSDGPSCSTTQKCKQIVKGIQNNHMNTRGWEDIGYNFLVGGDGNVYEGRGWGKHGSHAVPYNRRSIGICFLGSFQNSSPPNVQIEAAKDLIKYGVSKNLIASNYKVLGHRQATPTDCPGNTLYNLVKQWPNFLNSK